jgi:S1-C subfamily serine protease
MGLALTQAQVWFSKRSEQVAAAERNFIMLSRKATQRRRRRIQALVGVLSFAVAASLLGWMRNTYVSMREEREFAAAEMLSQAHTYELERNLAKLTGPTLSELKRLGDAMVFIKNKWYLHDQITQKQLFQRMDRINGELLPCFVRMDDGSVVRWLTLDDQGGLNTPVGVDQGGSGFVVAETGLIVTNKRYAAGWTMPYEDYPANGPWRGAVYPILKSDQQAVTTLDSRDLDMSGMVTKWVPSSGGYVFEPSRPNPISSGLRQFSGQNDLLTVQFSESRIGIDANLQRTAIDADLAVLKIQTTQPLSTLEFMDGDYQAEVGEKVFLLSYEPSQETVVSDPIVTVGMVSRISSKKDEGDYQFASLALPRSGGGPVLNSEGKVIGILISPGGDAHGAFAVRADYVRELFKPVSP